jgi:hypothetical protein
MAAGRTRFEIKEIEENAVVPVSDGSLRCITSAGFALLTRYAGGRRISLKAL